MTCVNPIIPGFAPDPTIVLIEDTFFLVNSSFHVFPGLPIYASQDLVTWKQIGNAINRRAQLSLRRSPTGIFPLNGNGDVLVGTGGLYAPTIRYHGGTIFVVCTNITTPAASSLGSASENFIVSTQDIWSGNWSDPVYFDFQGIDPSIFFDDDRRSYIQASAAPGPMTKIHLFEIDLKTGQKLSEEKMVWAGTGGVYPEGPHLYKKDGWYYLVISEGGTHAGHMVTIARSRAIFGPYEAFEGNPILTARRTGEYIQFTGHCDMFRDREGNWWGVCLGVRKDRAGRFIMGRESFITPGKWSEGGWPSLEPVKSDPRGLPCQGRTAALVTTKPMVDFVYIRDADLDDYMFSNGGRDIALKARRVDLVSPSESPTFIGKRQRQLEGVSSVWMTCPSPAQQSPTSSVKAGLAVYKDEHRHARVFYDDSQETALVFEVRNDAKRLHRTVKHVIEPGKHLALRLEYTEQQYRFSYRVPGIQSSAGWTSIGTLDTLDLTNFDFVGPIIGIFAVAGEEEQPTTIHFSGLEID
ncbi:murein transglycosylase [Cladophialophora psammophila CBS 110553]|uniref:Murein transglycosylase n=1 Tax=Cladophialophora psammophila CBS 110553 TaxID=1182543 RepID=W9XHK6_9EURO|nr:murein transglycosylase [Cladophialophora psammophila CBS 110553]EXJ76416.1 murein transglycosylase [Cladophialophora psammophila CBS 110553]